MTDLKPCPFCGKEVKIGHNGPWITIEHIEDGPCIWNVMDSNWVGSEQRLAEEWNRRVKE